MGVRQSGARWNKTGAGTNDGVTITMSAKPGKRHAITDFDAYSDTDANVTIMCDGVELWQGMVPAGQRLDRTLGTPLYGVAGEDVTLTIDVSTTYCAANMSGVTIRN